MTLRQHCEHREASLTQHTIGPDRRFWIGRCTCGFETRGWPYEYQAEGELYERHIKLETEDE